MRLAVAAAVAVLAVEIVTTVLPVVRGLCSPSSMVRLASRQRLHRMATTALSIMTCGAGRLQRTGLPVFMLICLPHLKVWAFSNTCPQEARMLYTPHGQLPACFPASSRARAGSLLLRPLYGIITRPRKSLFSTLAGDILDCDGRHGWKPTFGGSAQRRDVMRITPKFWCNEALVVVSSVGLCLSVSLG